MTISEYVWLVQRAYMVEDFRYVADVFQNSIDEKLFFREDFLRKQREHSDEKFRYEKKQSVEIRTDEGGQGISKSD